MPSADPTGPDNPDNLLTEFAGAAAAVSQTPRRLALLAGAALLAAALVFGATLALATHVKQDEFGTTGSGDAQFNTASGVAVNQDTNAVYVADNGNARVQVFDEDGNYQSEFGSSQLSRPEGIAIDQDTGHVYVTDSQARKVFKFESDGTYTGTSWGGAGTGDGQFADLTQGDNIAVDPDGNVWVTDAGGNRWVQKFDSSGGFITSVWHPSIGGDGTAVAAHPSADAVYVGTTSFYGTFAVTRSGGVFGFVDRGTPHTALGVDPLTELLYAFDPSVQEIALYDTASSPGRPAELERFGSGAGWATGPSTRNALAFSTDAGATGSLYATDGANDRVLIFFETPRPPAPPEIGSESSNERGDEATLRGEVNPVNSEITLCEFQWGTAAGTYPNSAPCDPMPVSGQRPIEVSAHITGLAEQTEYHWRLVAENGQGRTEGTDQMFTTSNLPEVTIDPPTDIHAHGATFSGTINPEGIRRTRYQFEVSDDGFATTVKFPSSPSNVSGTSPVAVEEIATGLKANADYEVRLHVTSRNGDRDSSIETFSTPAIPPTVEPGTATAGKESATLRAWVNPENAETTYFFEWGEDTSYGNQIPAPAGMVNDFEFLVLSEAITGLERNTTYHYRVVAENKAGRTEGPDQAVTTTDNGMLHDRAYELVTPSDGLGATILALNFGSAAEDGESFAWHSRTPFGEDVEGAPFQNTFLATRTEEGWMSTPASAHLGSDHTSGSVRGPGSYWHFTEDLSYGFYWDFVGGPDALASDPAREDLFVHGLPDGGYSLLTPEPPLTGGGGWDEPFVVGYSDDLNHVFVEPPHRSGSLCGEGFGGPCDVTPATGEARPVHVLPQHHQEVVTAGGTDAGTFTLTFDGQTTNPLDRFARPAAIEAELEALSNLDPSEVSVTGNPRERSVVFAGQFFNSDTPELSADDSAVGGSTTVEAGYKGIADDRAYLGHEVGGRNQNVAAHPGMYGNRHVSADGTRAVFTLQGGGTFLRDTGESPPTTTQLPGDDFVTANEDLSEIFVSGGRDRLTRYEVDTGTATSLVDASRGYSGFVRASDDASHIYFVSGAELTPADEAVGPGLYLWRDDGTPTGELQYVGRLSTRPGEDAALVSSAQLGPSDVTPDGRFLLFRSVVPLTAYDDTRNCTLSKSIGLGIDGPCPQIYIFDAAAPQGDPEKLRCVSCHPNDEPLQSTWRHDIERGLKGHGDASNLALATTFRITEPNYISDDGQTVFFQSHEPLLARDTNGTADIYEYDVPSGQLSLVTTGKAAPGAEPGSAAFTFDVVRDGFWILDASEDGDVFFATGKALVPQDQDSLADVYVARAGGGIPDPAPDRDCQGSECQGDPEPSADEDPGGTATASGPGNLDPDAQRCQRLVERFQALKQRFLALKGFFQDTDNRALKRRIARRARIVKRKAIQVRQAAIECRENL